MDYQRNDSGQVALKHYNSNPCTIRLNNGHEYSFVPKINVSMAWVDENDVPSLLSVQANICCGLHAAKFLIANKLDVCLWMTGDRC